MSEFKDNDENIHRIQRKLKGCISNYGFLIDCMRKHFNETRCYEAIEPKDVFDDVWNELNIFEQMNDVMESFVDKLGFLQPREAKE